MWHGLLRKPELRFILIFFFTYCILYAINYTWTGLTIQGGYYNNWIAWNADYISGLRNLLLQMASSFLSAMGYENTVMGQYLFVAGGKGIRIVYSCIGLNIIFVWVAFNIAFPIRLLNRILYIVAGIVLITVLNFIRIALVAISPYKGRFLNTPLDHHTVFNIVVYAFIIGAIIAIVNFQKLPVKNSKELHR